MENNKLLAEHLNKATFRRGNELFVGTGIVNAELWHPDTDWIVFMVINLSL